MIPGQHAHPAGATACTDCPGGQHDHDTSTATACLTCAAGKYTAGRGYTVAEVGYTVTENKKCRGNSITQTGPFCAMDVDSSLSEADQRAACFAHVTNAQNCAAMWTTNAGIRSCSVHCQDQTADCCGGSANAAAGGWNPSESVYIGRYHAGAVMATPCDNDSATCTTLASSSASTARSVSCLDCQGGRADLDQSAATVCDDCNPVRDTSTRRIAFAAVRVPNRRCLH